MKQITRQDKYKTKTSLQSPFENSQGFRLTDLDRKSVPSAKSTLVMCRRVSSWDEQIPSVCRPMTG